MCYLRGRVMLPKIPKLFAILLFSGAVVPQVAAAQENRSSQTERVSELQARLLADPANSDLMRQLASAQAAASKFEEALATIDRTSTLAPADNDIALARARILLWSGRFDEARAQVNLVRIRAPEYPELDEVQTAIQMASVRKGRQSGIALSAGIAGVDLAGGGSQGWESLTISAFTPLGLQNTLAASVEYEVRQASDTRLSLSLAHNAASFEIRLGASLTPDADFKEKWGLQAGADYQVHSNVVVISDVRYSRYDNLSVVSAVPGIRLQTADAAHALAVRLISIFRSDGDSGVGASARYDGEVGNSFRIFAGAASYPDTEAGITRQLRSAFAGVSLPLSDQISLNLTGEYDRRERSYTRKAMNLTLIVRLND